MKKLIAIAEAIALLSALCSCAVLDNLIGENGGSVSNYIDSAEPDYEYSETGIDALNDHAYKLLDEIKITNNEENVREGIKILLDDFDLLVDDQAHMQAESYLKWDDEELEAKYEESSEAVYVAWDALAFVFSKGYDSEEYSQLFEEYVTDEQVKYYTSRGMNLARAEGYASVDYRVSDEYLDEYYSTAYDDSLGDKEKNLQCAEIYLDILADYDHETFYEDYNRDYTPQEIIELAQTVREELIPASEELLDNFYDNKYCNAVFDSPVIVESLFGTVQQYASQLSPEIKKSADRLSDGESYVIATGDNCYNGSYTVDLPANNNAMMYIYTDNSYYDLFTAIHEFGHFHSSFQDDTKAYFTATNLDVAEIQSQGMELLFMQFYDEIYGKQSDAMKLLKLSDITDSIIMGFLIGEFEYTALERSDEMTAEEVLELYNEIMGDYKEVYPFYYVSHMFESPGYYVSYGVSALAAMDIVDECFSDPQQALEHYEKIAAVPVNSRDVRFGDSLEKCGFSDVLSEEYIRKLAEKLLEISNSISE